MEPDQVVEAWHWSYEVHAERNALNSEARDFLEAAIVRVRQQPCLERERQDVEIVFEQHESHQLLGMTRPVRVPYFLSGTRGAWQIALAGQALDHMTLKEELAHGAAFDAYDWLDRAINEEAALWAKLALLNHPQMLNEQDWSAPHQAYADGGVKLGALYCDLAL